jgi:molybdate transport system substrate-binding protein
MVSQETNINFIFSKVALGEAGAVFVHQSEVSPEYADRVVIISIYEKYNMKSEYSIGALNGSKSFDLAEKFINLIESDEGKTILEKHGYETHKYQCHEP